MAGREAKLKIAPPDWLLKAQFCLTTPPVPLHTD